MEFTITETQRSLPGTSTGVHGRFSTETGQGEIYKQLGNIGGQIGAFGENLYKLQGEAELVEKISEANEGFQKLQQELLEEPDPEEYTRRYNDYWNSVKGTKVKNGYARQRWNAALPSLQKSQQSQIFSDYKAKVRDNHEIATANVIAQYVQGSASRNAVVGMLESGRKLGKTDAEIELVLSNADAKRQSKLHSDQFNEVWERIGTDPEGTYNAAVERIETGKLPKGYEQYDALTDAQSWHTLRNYAKYQMKFNEKKNEKKLSGYLNTIHEMASRVGNPNLPPDQQLSPMDVQKYIMGLDVEPSVKTEMMEEVNKVVSVFNKSGVNMYNTTRDWPAYWDMTRRIAAGEKISDMDIHKENLSDPKLGPKWSTAEESRLISGLPDNKKDIMKTSFYDEWNHKINSIYWEGDGVPQDKIPEWSKIKDELEKIAKEHGSDYDTAQKKIEALLDKEKDGKAKGILARLWDKRARVEGTGITPFPGTYFPEPDSKTEKSPYKDYPDAFKEGGVWKVIRDGKKYRIED